MILSNSEIQAAWIAKLKATASITALVASAEIREDNWKGTDFGYPNIRVQLHPLIPTVQNSQCQVFSSSVSILVFGEQKSSKQVDDIAAVVAEAFWGGSFSVLGVHFSGIILTSIDPAEVPESDENSWRSAVNLTALVHRA